MVTVLLLEARARAVVFLLHEPVIDSLPRQTGIHYKTVAWNTKAAVLAVGTNRFLPLSLVCSHYKRVNRQRLSEPSRCNKLRLIRTLETAPLFTNWPKCSENVWVHHVGERGGISALTFWTLPRFTNSSFWEGDRKRKRNTRDNECVTRKYRNIQQLQLWFFSRE